MSLGVAATAVAVASALLCGPAQAQVAATVYATGQYQYNSNVFDLQRGFPSSPGDYRQGDEYFAYGAGLNLTDQISQQNVYLRGTLTQFDYDHFSQLTHYEYNGDAGWNWKFGDQWSGTFDVSRSRTMVPFVEIVSVALFISTDQREMASADYQFIPTWHFDVDGYTDKDDEPLPGEPNMYLADSGGDASIRFLGGAGVTGGFTVGYQHGNYTNATLFFSPSYNQWNYGLVAGYQPAGPGGLSSLDFGIGRTTRTSPQGVDDLSGWTGHLAFNRMITGKTSVQASVLRNINSFITGAGSELDTSAAVAVNWQATFKTAFNVGYTWLYSIFPDGGFLPGTTRHDHLQFATLSINYAALPWLTIRPYANFQTRSSDFYGANFNATIYGVLFTVAWQNRAAAGSAVGPLVPGIGPAGAPTGLPAAVP